MKKLIQQESDNNYSQNTPPKRTYFCPLKIYLCLLLLFIRAAICAN